MIVEKIFFDTNFFLFGCDARSHIMVHFSGCLPSIWIINVSSLYTFSFLGTPKGNSKPKSVYCNCFLNYNIHVHNADITFSSHIKKLQMILLIFFHHQHLPLLPLHMTIWHTYSSCHVEKAGGGVMEWRRQEPGRRLSGS